MKWLSLFSGIGAYDLGLEQAGHETIGFCENDKWAQKILKKHWPTKPISSSIQSLTRALMPSLGDGRAKILAPLEKVPDFRASVLDYGGISLEPFAWYDPSTQSWRTWQRCLVTEWETFSGTWPQSGMIRNGIAYQLPPLHYHTNGGAYGLWPTPQASDGPKHYTCSYKTAKKRLETGRQLHWLHRAILMRGQEGIYTANPRFAEEMMGLPRDYTALETETLPASSESLPKD